MHVIEVQNVNEALAEGLIYLEREGVPEDSRNGPVLVAPDPVTTVYHRPTQHVLLSKTRDANPFFHLMEALWMLAGRNDLEFPVYFNSRFGAYSDDGKTIRGAYGYRWRQWFGYDQLAFIILELKMNPSTRRAVLGMWDASDVPVESLRACMSEKNTHLAKFGDLLADTVDKPCNTHIYFDVRGGVLNMTVCCRSNDILWGAYGANAVHMAMLQEYVAAGVGVPMGVYRQMSNNYHLYTEVLPAEKRAQIIEECLKVCGRTYIWAGRAALVDDFETFDKDLQRFLADPMDGRWHLYKNTFFLYVAKPMYAAFHFRKKYPDTAMKNIELIQDSAWQIAAKMWFENRSK